MSDGRDVELYDSLDGQVALVTGATRGIGAEVASQLTDLGTTVYAGARDTADITAPDQRALELDVTDPDDATAVTDRLESEAGRLDILVNNAGVFERAETLHELSLETLDATFAVNLRGPMVVTRAVTPLLLEGDGGRVVNLSSDLGQIATMGGSYPAYRVSKAGLGGFTAYLDGEYCDEGLIANAASPGWVRTDMGGESAPRSPAEGADTPVWLSRFRPGSPGGLFWKDREVIEW